MKFFCYNYNRSWDIEKMIKEVTQMIEETKAYDHKEEFLLFLGFPYTHLKTMMDQTQRQYIKIVAQNVTQGNQEEVLGEITIPILKNLGVDAIFTGNLNRRRLFNENDQKVGEKVTAILKEGFKSLLFIGATLEERNLDKEDAVLKRQIKIGLTEIPEEALLRVGFVYMPSQEEEENHVLKISQLMRKEIRKALEKAPEDPPILFGGKMTCDEGINYLKTQQFDGIFVNEGDWSVEEFLKVIHKTMEK